MTSAWLGAIAYTLEIYYDFSGYSDMAIGLGRCLGFKFEENFNYPYMAKSITDFWRRWHISLTSWFRDYVYIPLGGNRVSASRHMFNLFVVWLCTGIWHGANWTFVVWGIIYWGLQIVERYFGVSDRMPRCIGRVVTLMIITVNWVIFRANDLGHAKRYISYMFGFGNSIYDGDAALYVGSSAILLLVACLGCIPWKRVMSNCSEKILLLGEVAKRIMVFLHYSQESGHVF